LNKPYYIGEARDIRKRLKQQFNPATSTFYKNFLKHSKLNQAIKSIPIHDFSFQFIETEIGRKEIEDFGISNLNTSLNRFQIGKRLKFNPITKNDLWNEVQKHKEELLIQAEEQIFKQKYTPWINCIAKSVAGIYIVKHKKDIIYIGESSDINERHLTHSTRTYFSALRRHVGTEILKHKLQERNGKKKYFDDYDDKKVTSFLHETDAIFYPVNFGRYELEEFLIKKHKPLLNRKDNKE